MGNGLKDKSYRFIYQGFRELRQKYSYYLSPITYYLFLIQPLTIYLVASFVSPLGGDSINEHYAQLAKPLIFIVGRLSRCVSTNNHLKKVKHRAIEIYIYNANKGLNR